MDVFEQNIVTTPGASEPQGSAVVSGSGVYTGSQVAGSPRSSSDNREGTGVASQAPETLDTTSAEEAGAVASQAIPACSTKTVKRNVIDIGALSETELLDKSIHYVESMEKFALNTRNVHREIKDTIPKLRMLLTQYKKVRNQGPGNKEQITPKPTAKDAGKSAATQTPKLTNVEKPDGPLTEMLERIQEQLTLQQGSIDRLLAEPHTADDKSRDQDAEPKPPRRRKRLKQRQSQQSHSWHTQPDPVRTLTAQSRQSDQSESPGDSEWTEVKRKKPKPAVVDREPTRPPRKPWDAAALVRKRTPKTKAVTISAPREGETYASVMKRVTQEVNLRELGVEVIKTRKTKSGAVLLEVGNSEEAEKLADRMRQVIGVDATVGRPTRKTSVLLLGIPEWMSPEDITKDVLMADESLSETQILVRDNVGGGRVVRLEVPMSAALRLAEKKQLKSAGVVAA